MDQAEIAPGRRNPFRWRRLTWAIISIGVLSAGAVIGIAVGYNASDTTDFETQEAVSGSIAIVVWAWLIVTAVLEAAWLLMGAVRWRQAEPDTVRPRIWIWAAAALPVGITTGLWWWTAFIPS